MPGLQLSMGVQTRMVLKPAATEGFLGGNVHLADQLFFAQA